MSLETLIGAGGVMQMAGTLVNMGEVGANISVQRNVRRMAVQATSQKKAQIRKARDRSFYKAVNENRFIDAQKVENNGDDALRDADLQLQQFAEQNRFQAKQKQTATLIGAPFQLAGGSFQALALASNLRSTNEGFSPREGGSYFGNTNEGSRGGGTIGGLDTNALFEFRT